MAPSTAIQLMQQCCNVTEITLDTCLNGGEVQKVVEIKFLRKLEICWIESVPIEPACSKLEVLVLKCEHWPSTCDYLYKYVIKFQDLLHQI